MSEKIEFKARPEVIWHSAGGGDGKIVQGPGIRLAENRAWTAQEYHVTLTPVEPERLCSVCGEPASEHTDGLFCCPHCEHSLIYMIDREDGFRAFCGGCGEDSAYRRTKQKVISHWNQRSKR